MASRKSIRCCKSVILNWLRCVKRLITRNNIGKRKWMLDYENGLDYNSWDISHIRHFSNKSCTTSAEKQWNSSLCTDSMRKSINYKNENRNCFPRSDFIYFHMSYSQSARVKCECLKSFIIRQYTNQRKINIFY